MYTGSPFYINIPRKCLVKFVEDPAWLHMHVGKKERFLCLWNNTNDFPIRKLEKHAARERFTDAWNPSAILDFL